MVRNSRSMRAISVVELIVVLVILGVLAAMAIPRFSRGADRAAEDELRQNLTILRTAIDLYYQDHRAFPGERPDGTAAGGPQTEAAFVSQLTKYTNCEGRVADLPGAEFVFGPYLKNGVPGCPVAHTTGASGVHIVCEELASAHASIDTELVGWVFNSRTGYVAACSDRAGASGVPFEKY